MQAAKDSFYMALRERLAALNPSRVFVVDGVERPGIAVRENLEPKVTAPKSGMYLIEWGDVGIAEATRPIMGMDCHIGYSSEGSGGTGVDRGRMLSEMDHELLAICAPPYTGMRDYQQSPSADLGCGVFWTMPELKNVTPDRGMASADSGRLERRAALRVYFFLPEVGA